ncbi:hypothetical protein GJR88_01684 [Dietzia sp. DQ12-45-1b]|nr:hypothetical protein GJR88_01684 [Dietzia sp. DQ12-45-1b]
MDGVRASFSFVPSHLVTETGRNLPAGDYARIHARTDAEESR